MDRSAQDYAYTLEGEHAMNAERMRREAHELNQQVKALLSAADVEDERARWARSMADALGQERSDG